MAEFTRNTSLGTSCNRQNMYDLINTADVTSISTDDLDSSFMQITAASEAPTFSEQLWWYDQTTQLLKIPLTNVGASPASLYLAVGPDAWHYPGYNAGAGNIQKGELVRWSYAADAGVYDCTPMEPATNVTGQGALRCSWELRNLYGFAQATIAPDTFGPVLTYGFGHALVDWPSVVSRFNSIQNKWAFELMPSSAYTGYCITTPRTEAAQFFSTVIAMGLAAPENTGVSVLCPIFCNLPAGKVQGDK